MLAGSPARKEATQTPSHERKNLNQADEIHTFEKGRLERVSIGDVVVQRLVLEPGWRSADPGESLVAAAWREAPHLQYHAAGRLHIVTASGEAFDAGPGEVISLAAGHEAYVLGEDPVVIVDLYSAVRRPAPRGGKAIELG